MERLTIWNVWSNGEQVREKLEETGRLWWSNSDITVNLIPSFNRVFANLNCGEPLSRIAQPHYVAGEPLVELGSCPTWGGHPPPLPLAPRLRRAQLLRGIRLWTCLQVTGNHFAKYSCWDFDISHRSDNDIIGELHQRVSALEDSEVALRDTYGSPYRWSFYFFQTLA